MLISANLFNRLTDLAETHLTSFYGKEDISTLQNILHPFPDVTPMASSSDPSTSLLNSADDAKVLRQMQKQQSQLESVDERADGFDETDATQVAATVNVDVHHAYDNHAAAVDIEDGVQNGGSGSTQQHTSTGGGGGLRAFRDIVTKSKSAPPAAAAAVADELSSDDQAISSQSTDSATSRRLVRQRQVLGEGDDASRPADGDGRIAPMDARNSSAASATSEDDIDANTLNRFLEMVRNRPADITRRMASDTTSNDAQVWSIRWRVLHNMTFVR